KQLNLCRLHQNIWGYALSLNGISGGCEITGSGQLDRLVFPQRQHSLNRAFAEAFGADNNAALVILNGAGENFRCRGAAVIDDDNQGQVVEYVAGAGAELAVGALHPP